MIQSSYTLLFVYHEVAKAFRTLTVRLIKSEVDVPLKTVQPGVQQDNSQKGIGGRPKSRRLVGITSRPAPWALKAIRIQSPNRRKL